MWCATCKNYKHPGTSHCHVCDNCVVGFDHHCIFLNTCVGHSNIRSFFTFLTFSVAALMDIFITSILLVDHYDSLGNIDTWVSENTALWVVFFVLLVASICILTMMRVPCLTARWVFDLFSLRRCFSERYLQIFGWSCLVTSAILLLVCYVVSAKNGLYTLPGIVLIVASLPLLLWLLGFWLLHACFICNGAGTKATFILVRSQQDSANVTWTDVTWSALTGSKHINNCCAFWCNARKQPLDFSKTLRYYVKRELSDLLRDEIFA